VFRKITHFVYKRIALQLLDVFLGWVPRYFRAVLMLATADSLHLRNLRFEIPLSSGEAMDEAFHLDMTAVPGDRAVIPFVAHRRGWEIVEPKMSLKCMPEIPSCEIIDLGANMGLYSLQFLALLKKAGRIRQVIRVHLIEPDPSLVLALSNNCEQFSNDVQFNILAKAVGGKDGRAVFHIDQENSTNNTTFSEAIRLSGGTSRFQIDVDVLSGKTLIEALQLLSQTRLIYKSDLQGSDPEVLATIPPEFWNRVEIMIIELWPRILSEKRLALDVGHLRRLFLLFNYRASIDRNGNITELTDTTIDKILEDKRITAHYNVFCARQRPSN